MEPENKKKNKIRNKTKGGKRGYWCGEKKKRESRRGRGVLGKVSTIDTKTLGCRVGKRVVGRHKRHIPWGGYLSTGFETNVGNQKKNVATMGGGSEQYKGDRA